VYLLTQFDLFDTVDINSDSRHTSTICSETACAQWKIIFFIQVGEKNGTGLLNIHPDTFPFVNPNLSHDSIYRDFTCMNQVKKGANIRANWCQDGNMRNGG